VNRAQRHVVIQKLLDKLYILKGRTIALLGLAFKPDTDDLRDAPSCKLPSGCFKWGRASRLMILWRCRLAVSQHPELKIQYCESALDAVTDADALVVVTEWAEFRTLDLAGVALRMARAVIVDGRNISIRRRFVRRGLIIRGLGGGSLWLAGLRL